MRFPVGAQSVSPGDCLLDLMSSWISHLPEDIDYQSVSGLGMNADELARNPRLDDYAVKNLNNDPSLPYPGDRFNAVMIAVSIQYLTKPFEVFKEIGRVLAPGGRCIVTMSHRLFPTKAIHAFHALSPADRCRLVARYMDQSGVIADIELVDRSPKKADPLWIVTGTKTGTRNLHEDKSRKVA